MLRSSACWLLTSLATTNAFTGCFVWSFITLANWFSGLAPTILNDGACAVLSPETLGACTGGPTAVIFLMFATPAATAAPAAIAPKAGPTIGTAACDA